MGTQVKNKIKNLDCTPGQLLNIIDRLRQQVAAGKITVGDGEVALPPVFAVKIELEVKENGFEFELEIKM